MEKRSLTAADLNEAFSAKKEISSLLSGWPGDPSGEGREKFHDIQSQLECVSLNGAETSTHSKIESMVELQSIFLRILHNLGPIIKGDYEKQFCQLEKRISESQSLESLCIVGDEINNMISPLINNTVVGIDLSNTFLVKLSKDL
jgi:hypothetical protein